MYIKKADFIKSCASLNDWLDDDIKEVCFLGRSNVGKSTFINVFCNKKKLAKTSQTPGKTRLLNLFSINDNQFRLVDTPGYGYAKINIGEQEKFSKLMDDYLIKRKSLKLACMLLDLRRVPSKLDVELYDFLKFNGRKVLIIGTKLDKLKKNDIQKQKKIITETIGLEKDDNFIITSSLDKKNIEEVQKYILSSISEI